MYISNFQNENKIDKYTYTLINIASKGLTAFPFYRHPVASQSVATVVHLINFYKKNCDKAIGGQPSFTVNIDKPVPLNLKL